MKKNAFFLMISILGVLFILLVGVAIAERNLIAALLSLLASILTIGIGFIYKKKWNDQEES